MHFGVHIPFLQPESEVSSWPAFRSTCRTSKKGIQVRATFDAPDVVVVWRYSAQGHIQTPKFKV